MIMYSQTKTLKNEKNFSSRIRHEHRIIYVRLTYDNFSCRWLYIQSSRNINCRLVQFDTSQWKALVQYEGFHYYWWYNRISFSWSQETYRGVDNLLLGHAYGVNRGKFVKILQEIGDQQ